MVAFAPSAAPLPDSFSCSKYVHVMDGFIRTRSIPGPIVRRLMRDHVATCRPCRRAARELAEVFGGAVSSELFADA